MPTDTVADAALPDSELMLKFESLGDNCELGLVQRRVGVEPLSLFRFAGVPLRSLIRALETRFVGMANPDHILVQPENGEYMIKLTRYDVVYHADVKIGEADPSRLHNQQVRSIGFLIRKLLADLENPDKIMVFRQNEPLSAGDLTDLRLALAAHGPATLLWVEAARPGHPPNTVVRVDDRLMVGFVRQLARRDNVPDLDLESWLVMLRKAYAVHTGGSPAADKRLTRTEVVFGRAGNAEGCTGEGWSAPEEGFTWMVGDRSVLTLRNPGTATDLWLEMDVAPFVAPPALPTQSLEVTANGEVVHVFDLRTRGKIGCTIPGRHFVGQETVELVLEHPNAATPRSISGDDDDRRLAIAFRGLSLMGD
jgi:hypothetical protein